MPWKSYLGRWGIAGIVMLSGATAAIAASPDFGPNVLIFDPSQTNIQQRVDDIFRQQERNQFGGQRYALLFEPGVYHLDVQVGFYTQVMGVGTSPDDTEIVGAVRSTSGWMGGNATCNFWRSAENLAITPAGEHPEVQWSVSQGTDLRRDHFKGELHLWDWGWSSGGFLANCKIDGRIVSGSQQQWLSRNSEWGAWDGGVWNMVFVGVNRLPDGEWPQRPYTAVDRTPVVREKPYLTIDGNRQYSVVVPALQANSAGADWSDAGAKKLPLDQFYIAHPNDTSTTINAALSAGKDLLITPGVYHLDQAVHITRPDTVVLGLGYPTLIPSGDAPAMTVADVAGVKIGGLIFDAGPRRTPTLLQVGDARPGPAHADDPICLYDICARAGGASAGTTDAFVTINANDVIGDNLWLWRADHGEGAGWDSNKVKNGLIVNGANVTLYALFVEHCQEYQTLWNGEGGRVYFYQSELPYDPPNQAAWTSSAHTGYASYKVADGVRTHEAWGLGIYSYFTAAPVTCENAIESPDVPGVRFHDMTTVRLGGQAGSGITHVINGRGEGKMIVEPTRVKE
jgi:hypothetical protein